MAYQQCRYKNEVAKIPVQRINGQFYMFLKDVHDYFPGIQSFTCNGKPIPFENGRNKVRIEPARIQTFTEKVIHCHKSLSDDTVTPEIDYNLKQEMLSMRGDMKKSAGISLMVL
jgi:hypothetical protein